MLQLLLCQKEFKYFSSEIPVIIGIVIVVKSVVDKNTTREIVSIYQIV